MEPLLSKDYVQDILDQFLRTGQEKKKQSKNPEFEKQSQREQFIAEITNPHLTENPVFAI